MLFAGYLALQIPSNLLLTRVRPSLYLSICMALWGVVSGCTALAKDFRGLVVCRFFLGFLEAPFFPGALFLLSSWYTPKELATRTAVMYTGSLLSSAFGGLIGAGVQYGLDGVRGLHPWQWLFIIEGSVTVALSLGSIFILPDFPATTRWLTPQEKAIAIHRLRVHSGSVDEERGSIVQGLKMAIMDYKVWLLTLIVILKTSAGAVTSFIPTLVATFEFGNVQSLLMTAPPYIFAAIVAIIVSVSSDKLSERYFHLVCPLAVGLIGYIVAAATTTLAPRYFSLFLMLGGVYGCFDITYAWISSTVSDFSFPVMGYHWGNSRSSGEALLNIQSLASPSHRETFSCFCHCQHGRQYCTDLLALSLREAHGPTIPPSYGRQYRLRSRNHHRSDIAALLSPMGESQAREH